MRARLRDLGVFIGRFPLGTDNAITDVSGVTVGHRTLIAEQPNCVRTGVTVVLPRGAGTAGDASCAGYHSFNGCGEMTGLLWVEESGMLASPVALTNTAQVGSVRDAIAQYGAERHRGAGYYLPVAAETYDGWLSDPSARPVTTADVFAALDQARGGPVPEGNVGGGTGMVCHDLKGGIGTSSRLVRVPAGSYVVGALVQANYGSRHLLRVDGVPVGRELGFDQVPSPWETPPALSSIIVVIGTDAPLIPTQCRRLAQRATVGMARVGGVGFAFSGDLFLAFATGNHITRGDGLVDLSMVPPQQMDPLFEAAAEAVEESILNALVAADTLSGFRGRTAYALPHETLRKIMARYRPRPDS